MPRTCTHARVPAQEQSRATPSQEFPQYLAAPAKPLVESFRCLAGNKLKQLLKLLASPSMRHSMLGLDTLICQHLTVKLSLLLMQSAWISCLKKEKKGGKKRRGFYSKMNPAEKAASHLPELCIISFYLPAQSRGDLWSSARQQIALAPQSQPCHPHYCWSVCPF